MADKQAYPMISEKNWWDLRNQFKKTIPGSVNPSYVKSLLGFNSDDSAKNNIILPLKQLGIIDDEGKPTPLANEWRSDEKYGNACKTMLAAIYPRELTDLFPDEEIDASRVKSWFMDTAAIGQSAAGKITNTFILIRTAKVKQATEKKSAAPKKETPKKKAKAAIATTEKPVIQTQEPCVQEPAAGVVSPSVHIDIQVHIAPDASAEQIDKIFESMAKHLYGRT